MTQETDILVESVETAAERLQKLGAEVITRPENIPVGKVAIIKDPFGNIITLVDLSQGTYATDDHNTVTSIEHGG